MPRHGKQYAAAKAAIEARPHGLSEAVEAIKGAAFSKFDETMEVAINLGVDPRHADQMVRASVVLPHGTGKTKRVLVFAQGEKIQEAESAGADTVGGEELVEKIREGWLDFEAVVATPDMMRQVGKLGRVLGPRGMMPNPKSGTVTFEVAKAIEDIKAGKLDFRVDKNGVVHAPIGRLSFDTDALVANLSSLLAAVLRAKPASAKGNYVQSIYLTSTMGPSLALDVAEATAK